MKFTILSICLVFALQVQASYILQMFHNSKIYKSCFGESSETFLNMGHDAVEGINDELLYGTKSTTETRSDEHQVEENSEQVRESVETVPTGARGENFTTLATKVLQRDTVTLTSPQEQLLSLVNIQFKRLINRREYAEIGRLATNMDKDMAMKQLFPLITTLEHYNGLAGYLKSRRMGPSFFVHGKMEVVKEVIAGIKDYDTEHYIKGGDLEVALPLALKGYHHDRVIKLLVAKYARITEQDQLLKRVKFLKSCGRIIDWLFDIIAPWENSISLKRFLTLWGEEFNNRYPDVYEIFCQGLVHRLSIEDTMSRGAMRLLVDLVAQPSLLTPTAFVNGFLHNAWDIHRHNFFCYSWKEAVEEGLKPGHKNRGEHLWDVLTNMRYPGEFPTNYPPSPETLAAVLQKFPSKQELEDAWAKENVPGFLEKVMVFITTLDILPKVLTGIVIGYAAPRPTWLDSEKAMIS